MTAEKEEEKTDNMGTTASGKIAVVTGAVAASDAAPFSLSRSAACAPSSPAA